MSDFQRDIIIVGGGAAGILCAIKCAQLNKSVTIIEKQNRLGRKLLSTGNGRCNLTNKNINSDMYHGSFKDYAQSIFDKYTTEVLIKTFNDFGLLTRTDVEGRVYPYSNHASSLLDVLMFQLDKFNIEVICNEFVQNIIKNDKFCVKTLNNNYYCNKLVITTGSKANSKLGADDSGIKMLKKIGIKTISLSPALCPVPVNSKSLKIIKGLRSFGKVSLLDKNNVIYEEIGEIQFTEKALSGVCIFNLSSYIKDCKAPKIKISLLPQLSIENITAILKNKKQFINKNSEAVNLLIGIFHHKLSLAIIKECNLNNKLIKDINDNDIIKISNFINNWVFVPTGDYNFDNAQVVAGGVSGEEINPKTMETYKIKNLYVCGEAIDINGDCGGYNLHFAFASGLIAGENI